MSRVPGRGVRGAHRAPRGPSALGSFWIAAALLFLPACGSEPDDIAPASTGARFNTILVLGETDGPEEQLFGRIKDVALDSLGSIYVLDSRPPTLRVYSTSGEHEAAWDARGDGPGEFRAPAHLAVTDGGLVVVTDRLRSSLIVLRWEGRDLRHLRDVRLPGAPAGLCTRSDSALVMTTSDPPLFWVRLTTGELSALPVRAEANPLARGPFLDGRLLCPRGKRGGVWGNRLTGHLQVLGNDGALRPGFELPRFRPMDTLTVGRRFIQRVPEEGVSTLDFLEWLDDSTMVIQVGDHPPPGEPAEQLENTVRTYLKRAAPSLMSVRDWPGLSALRFPLAITVCNEMVPKLRLLRLQENGFPF